MNSSGHSAPASGVVPGPQLSSSVALQHKIAEIPPCSLTIDDIGELYTLLGKLCKPNPQGKNAESFDSAPSGSANSNRQFGRLMVGVYGANGEMNLGDATILSANSLPKQLRGIVYDNFTGLDIVDNRLKCTIDFTNPQFQGLYDPWSAVTPTNSSIEIYGDDKTWVIGAHTQVVDFFKERKLRRVALHTPRLFAFLSWVVGMPLSLLIADRADRLLLSGAPSMSPGLRVGLDIYVGLLAFMMFRNLILFTRWLFPKTELAGSRQGWFRGIASVILTSLFMALLYDLLKVGVTSK